MSKGNDRPVRKVFTTRAGGVSLPPYDSFNLGDHVGDALADVTSNRNRLARVVGLESHDIVWMEQIHSVNVTVVSQPQGSAVEATDALVTTTRGLALAVLAADCVPVLLSDTEVGVVAAVHAGRMGARNGIVRRTIDAMADLGATPRNVHALLGPAASGRQYEVPAGMAADVERHLPGALVKTNKGTSGLDLRRGLARQLLQLGVKAIDIDPRCTIEDKQLFSYRREGKTGRHAGLVWLP